MLRPTRTLKRRLRRAGAAAVAGGGGGGRGHGGRSPAPGRAGRRRPAGRAQVLHRSVLQAGSTARLRRTPRGRAPRGGRCRGPRGCSSRGRRRRRPTTAGRTRRCGAGPGPRAGRPASGARPSAVERVGVQGDEAADQGSRPGLGERGQPHGGDLAAGRTARWSPKLLRGQQHPGPGDLAGRGHGLVRRRLGPADDGDDAAVGLLAARSAPGSRRRWARGPAGRGRTSRRR